MCVFSFTSESEAAGCEGESNCKGLCEPGGCSGSLLLPTGNNDKYIDFFF